MPWHGRGRLRVDSVGMPVVDITAGELRACTFCAQRIARGMAGAAMRQPLDEVGAAIPFRAPGAIRPVCPAAEEQQFPACDDEALIERTIEKGKPSVGFPLREYWIDVGRLDDLQRATDEFNRFFR